MDLTKSLIPHLVHQRAMLASLAGVALRALLTPPRNGVGTEALLLPGRELRVDLPSPSAALVRDYVAHVGGDSRKTAGTVPPHLFPQFSMPLAAETLRGLPYPIHRIVNAGCRLEIHHPLVLGERLHVRARLESIDDDGRRALLHQRIVAGQPSTEEALVAHVYAVMPLTSRGAAPERKKRPEATLVPADAEKLDMIELKRSAGLEFALLTGDFNPVHWVRPYARAFGHRGTILHGFASLARVYEALLRTLSKSAAASIRILDVRFVRPLVLPASVGVYRRGDAVYVGLCGEPAYLAGRYEAGDERRREEPHALGREQGPGGLDRCVGSVS